MSTNMGLPRTPSYHEVAAWNGFRVDEIDGAGVGRAEGMFVDQVTGEPAWLLVKLSRFGGVVPVPVHDCAGVIGQVWVAHEKDVIKTAPTVDPGHPLNREQELAVCEHYAIAIDQGRASQVRGREAGSITSQSPATAEPGAS